MRPTRWQSYVAVPSHVPAGMYAKQSLQTLGLWDSVLPHLLHTSNVRRALRLVEMAEADFGVIYQSDVHASTKVQQILLLPQDSHSAIEYSIAVTNTGDRSDVHHLFDFLADQSNEPVWNSWGFSNVEHDHAN